MSISPPPPRKKYRPPFRSRVRRPPPQGRGLRLQPGSTSVVIRPRRSPPRDASQSFRLGPNATHAHTQRQLVVGRVRTHTRKHTRTHLELRRLDVTPLGPVFIRLKCPLSRKHSQKHFFSLSRQRKEKLDLARHLYILETCHQMFITHFACFIQEIQSFHFTHFSSQADKLPM